MTALDKLASSIKTDTSQGTKSANDFKSANMDTTKFSKLLDSASKSYSLNHEQVQNQKTKIKANQNFSYSKQIEDLKSKISGESKATNENHKILNEAKKAPTEVNLIIEELEKRKAIRVIPKSFDKIKNKSNEKESISSDKKITSAEIKTIDPQALSLQIMAAQQPIALKLDTVADDKNTDKLKNNNSQQALTQSILSGVKSVAENVKSPTANIYKENQNPLGQNAANQGHNPLIGNKNAVNPDAKINENNKNLSNVDKVSSNSKISEKLAIASSVGNENGIMAKVSENQMIEHKFDVKELTNKIKLKPEISAELKPVITKLNVQTNAKESDLNNSNNSNLLNSTLLHSDNSMAKLHFENTAQFDKILQSNQPKPSMEKSVMDQVSKKTLNELTSGKSEISIILKPENLGKVQINLVTQNGSLTAQITAENAQVKDILSKGLETLKQNLQDQGMNVTSMVIKVQEPATAENNNNNNNFQFDQQTSQNMTNANSNSNQSSSNSGQATTENNFSSETEEETGVKAAVPETNSINEGTVDFRA